MYCSIQEAWSNNDIEDNINKIMPKSSVSTAVENFTDKDIEQFLAWKNNNDISKECLNIIDHFKNCEKCQKYYKININSFDLNNLISKLGVSLIDNTNREIIVVFLLGLILILIFHLFNK